MRFDSEVGSLIQGGTDDVYQIVSRTARRTPSVGVEATRTIMVEVGDCRAIAIIRICWRPEHVGITPPKNRHGGD